MQSAINSRDTREYFIPSMPIVSPSEITGVPNITGLPLLPVTAWLTTLPKSRICALHGVMLLYGQATVIIGLVKSSSLNPTARSIALLGARFTQSLSPGILVNCALLCFKFDINIPQNYIKVSLRALAQMSSRALAWRP